MLRWGLFLRYPLPLLSRVFLKFLHDVEDRKIPRSIFFEALKSQRRLAHVGEMSYLHHQLLSDHLTAIGIDHLVDFPELANYDVFSADGHFIEHPSHIKCQSKQRVYAAGNIYIQNIRNGLLQLLTPVTDGSAKEHELPHFKHAIGRIEATKKSYGW